MLRDRLLAFSQVRAVVRRLGEGRADRMVGRVEPYLESGSRILDIGAGTCQITEKLRLRGFEAVPCDVRDLSCVPGIVPLLYRGPLLPFAAGSFDCALLITVLHHVTDQEALLREAARVAGRVLVYEDVYSGRAQMYVTHAADSVVNLEFAHHPHTNRTDADWCGLFRRLGLEVAASEHRRFGGVFSGALYVLDVPSRPRACHGSCRGAPVA